MGCAQRRIGPYNLGGYGILSSIINGCNLIIAQFIVPKLHLHFGFQSFPICPSFSGMLIRYIVGALVLGLIKKGWDIFGWMRKSLEKASSFEAGKECKNLRYFSRSLFVIAIFSRELIS